MAIVPLGSAVPPKRRRKSQSKTRRSRANSRSEDDAAKQVSILAEKTRCEDSSRRVAYASTNQPNGESMTTAIPIRPVASTTETQLLSKKVTPLSCKVGMPNTLEDFFSLDGLDSTITENWNDVFTPDRTPHLMQSQVTSAPQMDHDFDTAWFLFQDEIPRILRMEKESMKTTTTMNLDPNTSGPFPFPDFSFGHSGVSSPDSAFDFNQEIDLDPALTVTGFPIDNWHVPDFQSRFADLSTAEQINTSSAHQQQTGFCMGLRQDTLSGSNGITSDEIGIHSSPSFNDQLKLQDPSSKKNVAKSLVDSWPYLAECGIETSTISPQPSVTSSEKGRLKRSFFDEDNDDRGEESHITNCGRPSRDSGGERLLACPFHKKDPQRHQECGKYTLRRIKDVKQHIYRLHCKPELYCSRCFQNFKGANERDQHIRGGGCTLKEVPNLDGIISEHQRKELKDCSSRGTSKQQQWMELWEVIFPGGRPPRSPFIDNGQAELLSSLRSYWDDNAGEIITRFLGDLGPEYFGSAQLREVTSRIQQVVDLVLDHFGTESSTWDLTTNRARSGMLQQPPASESAVEEMLSHKMLPEPDQQSEIEFASWTLTANSPDVL
ncbi:hypothetical protein HD806DRAFT_478222 [Xylariaceae sp. AK1471]|nr:hypothetical protein HD806DRAFT_478222 [Xylariaceae sp. AK1471]